MFRSFISGLVWLAVVAAAPAQAIVMPIDAARTLKAAGLEACTPAPAGFGAFALGLERALSAPREDVVLIDV